MPGQVLAWQVQFGGPGFAPVSGDFDGDGLSDLAVYDLAQGRWYAQTTSGTVILWGMLWTGPGLAPL